MILKEKANIWMRIKENGRDISIKGNYSKVEGIDYTRKCDNFNGT